MQCGITGLRRESQLQVVVASGRATVDLRSISNGKTGCHYWAAEGKRSGLFTADVTLREVTLPIAHLQVLFAKLGIRDLDLHATERSVFPLI